MSKNGYSPNAVENATLMIASTLSRALPPPWGPVVNGYVSVLQLMTGPKNDEIPSAIDNVVEKLESFMQQQNIATYATIIYQFADEIQRQTVLMENKDSRIDNSAYYKNELIPLLQGAISPNTTNLSRAISELYENFKLDDRAYEALVSGVTLYYLAHRWLIQSYASLAADAFTKGDVEAFNQYNQLWINAVDKFLLVAQGRASSGIKGWTDKVYGSMNDRLNNRLATISAIYKYEKKEIVRRSINPMSFRAAEWSIQPGWTFKDSTCGDDDLLHFVGENESRDAQGQVDGNRSAYIQKVSLPYWIKVGKDRATAINWYDTIEVFSKALPPAAPRAAPTVVNRQTSVSVGSATIPAKAYVISYYLTYVYPGSDSLPSPMSMPIPCDLSGSAFIKISRERENTALSIKLHRLIRSNDTHSIISQCICTLPNANNEYLDSFKFEGDEF